MKSQADTMTEEQRENWREALPLLDASLDRLSPEDREILYCMADSFKTRVSVPGRTRTASTRANCPLGCGLGRTSDRGGALDSDGRELIHSAAAGASNFSHCVRGIDILRPEGTLHSLQSSRPMRRPFRTQPLYANQSRDSRPGLV